MLIATLLMPMEILLFPMALVIPALRENLPGARNRPVARARHSGKNRPPIM